MRGSKDVKTEMPDRMSAGFSTFFAFGVKRIRAKINNKQVSIAVINGPKLA